MVILASKDYINNCFLHSSTPPQQLHCFHTKSVAKLDYALALWNTMPITEDENGHWQRSGVCNEPSRTKPNFKGKKCQLPGPLERHCSTCHVNIQKGLFWYYPVNYEPFTGSGYGPLEIHKLCYYCAVYSRRFRKSQPDDPPRDTCETRQCHWRAHQPIFTPEGAPGLTLKHCTECHMTLYEGLFIHVNPFICYFCHRSGGSRRPK